MKKLIAAGMMIFAAIAIYKSQQDQQDQQYQQDLQDQPQDNQESTAETIMTTINNTATSWLGLWTPPAKYSGDISAAESRYNLPTNILARLLYQESRYREDIITGRTTSPVGALGIAQFMPATARDMGIDPLNTAQAIDAAGRYLASLYRQTGTWAQALAAYNWGIGNVQRKGLSRAPTETRNYYTQIMNDVGLTA